MFTISDVVLVNKIDVLPYFDFSLDAVRNRVKKLNPKAKVIPISARTGEGLNEWTQWLRSEIKAWSTR